MATLERPPKRKGRLLHDQEEWLWREVTKDIRSYRPQGAMPRPTPERAEQHHKVQKNVKLQPAVARVPAPILSSGLDGATAKRLSQGRIMPEATLDLHGLTQDHAHIAMERFLTTSVRLGRRCVLVITGKGGPKRHGDETGAPWAQRRPGILRSLVPLWLEHSAHRTHIVSMRAAHARHGGDGAIYLYLRTR